MTATTLKRHKLNKNSFAYKIKKDFKNNRGLYALIIPGFLLLILFSFVPLYGITMAFQRYDSSLGVFGSPFIGFENFRRFFSSPYFSEIFRNTLLISLFSLVVGFVFPLIFALSLNSVENLRFKKFVQMISYAPYFISVVVIVAMINIFFDGDNSVFANFVRLFGGEVKNNPITDPKSFYSLYVWSGLWQILGWNSIIYVSALSSVSPELYEAATLEGATKLQKIWYIELPTILPTIVTLLILSAGSILGVGFEKVYLMQNADNLETSEVISTYVYKKGILSSDYGLGTAVGLFNSVISFLMLMIVNFFAKKFTKYSVI
ncbi:MAG: ABC transporter permease [Bacilli bacterium]